MSHVCLVVRRSKLKIYDKSTLDNVLYKQQLFEMQLMRKMLQKKLADKNHVNITVLGL